MAVKGLTPQLAERGKIKIGERGEMKTSQGGKQFAQPRKLDHFLITTMQRDAAGRLMPDAALMARLKPEGGKITEIPVRLLYDDIDLNFPTRFASYRGTRCWCSGDGEVAHRLTGENGKYQEVACPCERVDPLYAAPDKCKILGTLQVLIEGVDRIGGVWKYRTTSWNTVNAILSSLALVKTVTGGPLAGIPLHLVLSPKTVTVPTTGQSMLVYVVSLEFRGTESQLAELGYDIARKRMEHRVKMEQIEAEARTRLLPPQQEPLQEQEETAQEFYPEGMEGGPQPTASEPSGPTVQEAKPRGNGRKARKHKVRDIGPCHYHPDRPATWSDENGIPRCEGCGTERCFWHPDRPATWQDEMEVPRCEGCEPPPLQEGEGKFVPKPAPALPPASAENLEVPTQPKTLF